MANARQRGTRPARTLLKNFVETPHFRLFSVLFCRGLGAIANLALVFLIAAKSDVATAGKILFLWSTAQFIGTLSRGGTDTILLRKYAQAIEMKDLGLANGILAQCVGLSVAIGTTFSTIAFLVVLMFPGAVAGVHVADAWIFLAALPFLAAGLSSAEALKAVGSVELAGFFQSGFLSSVACVALLSVTSSSPLLLSVSFLVASLIIFILNLALHVRRVKDCRRFTWVRWSEIKRSAWRIFMIELLRIGTMWIPMLSVSWSASPKHLGWFMIAMRLSMALNVVGAGVNALVGSRVARLLAQRDSDAILVGGKKLFSIASKLAPVACVFGFLISALAVNVMDSQYQGATLVFAAAFAGQSFRAAFGYIGVTMSILHFEHFTLRASILGFLIVAILAFPLTFFSGAVGAAAALAIGILGQSMCNIFHWRRIEQAPSLLFQGPLGRV